MQTISITNHTVIITQADFIAWLQTNAAALPLISAALSTPSERDGRVLDIIFPVDQAYLDTFLHSVIVGLPLLGAYKYEVISGNSDLIAKITWTT